MSSGSATRCRIVTTVGEQGFTRASPCAHADVKAARLRGHAGAGGRRKVGAKSAPSVFPTAYQAIPDEPLPH
jgi:hypothetical protein